MFSHSIARIVVAWGSVRFFHKIPHGKAFSVYALVPKLHTNKA